MVVHKSITNESTRVKLVVNATKLVLMVWKIKHNTASYTYGAEPAEIIILKVLERTEKKNHKQFLNFLHRLYDTPSLTKFDSVEHYFYDFIQLVRGTLYI